MTLEITRKELVTLLDKLVGYDTVNNLPKGKKVSKDCPEYIANYLQKNGVEAKIYEDEGFYSVYGQIGEGNYHLLLMAHFDVVPVGDGWETNPFVLTIKENTAYGRGVIDNKNNIASFMAVLPALTKLDLGDMTVCFDFSGDEEIGGVHGSGNYQKKFDRMPDAVINGDSAGMVIVARRRNAMGATIRLPKKRTKIRGTKLTQTFQTQQYGRHTAYQHRGADIHCLLKSSVEVAFNDWKVIAVEADFIKGNVIPDECTLTVIVPSEEGETLEYDRNLTLFFETLRFLVNVEFPTEFSTYGITIGPNMLFDRDDSWEIKLDIRAMTQDYTVVETALNRMCRELYGVNNYQLEFKPGQGRVNTSRNTLLIQTALEISKKFDFPAEIVEMGGASDARYFSREGIPTFDFGPKGGNVHASNEWLDLPSFVKVTEFYYEMVKAIARRKINTK